MLVHVSITKSKLDFPGGINHSKFTWSKQVKVYKSWQQEEIDDCILVHVSSSDPKELRWIKVVTSIRLMIV